RGGDATSDSPDQDPLALCEPRLRYQHPVRSLEDERKRRRLLEGEIVGNRVDLGARYRDQLRVRAVRVLADDVDPSVVLDARVDDDTLAAADQDTSAVGAEDATLRNRRKALAD